MSDFVVRCRIGYSTYISKVYAIDAATDRFLITDEYDTFFWVPMCDCMLVRDEFDTEE